MRKRRKIKSTVQQQKDREEKNKNLSQLFTDTNDYRKYCKIYYKRYPSHNNRWLIYELVVEHNGKNVKFTDYNEYKSYILENLAVINSLSEE